MGFASVLTYAQQLVRSYTQPGDRVIDATIGNGNDTLFLAELVGKRGMVYGFDIQREAIDNTTQRFARADRAMDNVRLILDSHDRMLDYIPAHEHERIAAIMFNLGYLPGADETVITTTSTTLSALRTALAILRPHGIVTAVLYPGHTGGDEEAAAVQAWAQSLPAAQYQVLSYRYLNKPSKAPYLLAIEKRTTR